MNIEGTHQFKAPRSQVWRALLDPQVLAQALPGGDQLEQVGENDYKAAMNVRVGPVQGRFDGKVTLTDLEPEEAYQMKVSGQGAPGFLNGEGRLRLTDAEGGTLLTYSGEVQVGGRIAGVGQRLLESTAKSMIRQGLKTLDDQLAAPSQPREAATTPAVTALPPVMPSAPVSTEAAAPVAAPDMGKMAAGVMREVVQDLAADYVPREKQPQVAAFVLGALSMLLFVILVRLVQRD
jgi:carbon monoxide dehydrogenase subunit G